MRKVASERRRFGYRRIHVMLDRHRHEPEEAPPSLSGREADRSQTWRAQACLMNQRPLELRSRPNERWSLDFVSDAFTDGRRFRVLAVVDDFTGECLAPVADTSLSGCGLLGS